MGPGMMDSQNWDEMAHMHGHGFDTAWVQAMIGHHTAEIALCTAELRSGTNPPARALARSMLTERHAELTQLRDWRGWAHD